MDDEATRRGEYFKMRFAVSNIAMALANKYAGAAPDLLSTPREERERMREIGVSRARWDGATFSSRNIAC